MLSRIESLSLLRWHTTIHWGDSLLAHSCRWDS